MSLTQATLSNPEIHPCASCLQFGFQSYSHVYLKINYRATRNRLILIIALLKSSVFYCYCQKRIKRIIKFIVHLRGSMTNVNTKSKQLFT